MSKIFHLTGQLCGAAEVLGFSPTEAWVVEGKLTYRNPALPPQPRGGGLDPVVNLDPVAAPDNLDPVEVTELRGYIYPGLLDAHTHPGLTHTATPPSDEEIRQRLETHRGFGVTQIIDCGGQRNPNVARREGDTKVVHCGRHIARPKRYIRNLATEIEPEDLPRVALEQLARSDGWIKLVGDWVDRSLGDQADLLPLWPRQVLRETFDEVHRAGGRVTVHTFARETIDDLLYAGVDAIEHGAGMAPDQVIEVARRGIRVTPTVRQVSEFPWYAAQAGKYPIYARRMLAMAVRRGVFLERLWDSGVPLVMGSDSSVDLSEKNLAVELLYAVAAGMDSSLAVRAASWQGLRVAGFTTWEEGAGADFVVYAGNPEIDITEVSRPVAVLVDGLLAPVE